MKSRIQKLKGFTLVELMAVIAATWLEFLAILYTPTRCNQGSANSWNMVQATHLTRHVLDYSPGRGPVVQRFRQWRGCFTNWLPVLVERRLYDWRNIGLAKRPVLSIWDPISRWSISGRQLNYDQGPTRNTPDNPRFGKIQAGLVNPEY